MAVLGGTGASLRAVMENPGNIFGPIALVAWIPFTFYLFTRFKPAVAGTISVVGGALFLPEKVKFLLPLLPDLDKTSITVIATFLACFVRARAKIAENKAMSMDVCLAFLLVGQIGMWLTNTDWLVGDNAPAPRPGLTYYESIAGCLSDIVNVYGMFWLGRTLVSRSQDAMAMARTTMGLGLVYAVCCLIEIRLSPQMHFWFYGFAQHDFMQTMRGGGFRPMVFSSHGIVVARFMAVAALMGVLLWRLNGLKPKQGWMLLAMIAVFVLCKSTGAIVLFAVFGPLVALTKSSTQARLAFAIAVIVATYPALRGADYIPVDDALELARKVSQERADSLQTRFDNEGLLLARARERMWFGWGGFDRHNTFNEHGQPQLIVDGEWIGTFVTRGIIGFIGYYGLYVFPLFYALRRLKTMTSNELMLLLCGIMLASALLTFDTLPNSSLTLPQFFWAGALAGAARGLAHEDAVRRMKLREIRRRQMQQANPAAA
jgi:hypothetical protein